MQYSNIIQLDKKIAELVEYSKDENNIEYREIEFGIVSNQLGQSIKQLIDGRECNRVPKTISSSQIQHAIKGHGNIKAESDRGQKAICDDDFKYIPQIVNRYDTIDKSNKPDTYGNPGILFTKNIQGGTYFVVMSVKSKKDKQKNGIDVKFDFATMWIKKIKPTNKC